MTPLRSLTEYGQAIWLDFLARDFLASDELEKLIERDGLTGMTSRVSPNGEYQAFMSERSLTGYDNTDANSGVPDEEVYLYDAIEHNVTSEGGPQKFASKNLAQGGTFEIKAINPGVIHYECTIHPTSMNGTIEVVS